MSKEVRNPSLILQANARAARLAEELRANLARRKSQSRARRAGDEDATEGLPAVGPEPDHD